MGIEVILRLRFDLRKFARRQTAFAPYMMPLHRCSVVTFRDNFRAMNSTRHFSRVVAALTLAMFTTQVVAQDVTITVNRLAADRYEVVKGKNVKPGELILQTKYCYVFARNEEAIFLTREDQNGEAAVIYFASGDQCEVVKVDKTTDADFSLIDFLIQLGLLLTGKGSNKTPTAVDKGRGNR